MIQDADVIILGAGCAGLSLAVALANQAPTLRVQLLEKRVDYRRDRTWCFWDTAQHPFTAGVTHTWDCWRVRLSNSEVRQRSRCFTYQHLPADRFYDLALHRVQRAGQALKTGVTVCNVQQENGLCEVNTDAGCLRSRWVFDSRPLGRFESQPMLLQRFLGWHVRCARPCFDASMIELMDFQQCIDQERTMFFYVLPFSATEALVEVTLVEDARLPDVDPVPMLQRYLHKLCDEGYEVLYRETATLPMGNWRNKEQPSHHVVDIGTRGGRVKASSGYAFQRIQQQSKKLAWALAHDIRLPQRIEPRVFEVLDHIFLQALLRAPERAADYFMALFKKVPADTLVRFMSETASAGEVLRVMLALPKADFLKAAVLPKRRPAA